MHYPLSFFLLLISVSAVAIPPRSDSWSSSGSTIRPGSPAGSESTRFSASISEASSSRSRNGALSHAPEPPPAAHYGDDDHQRARPPPPRVPDSPSPPPRSRPVSNSPPPPLPGVRYVNDPNSRPNQRRPSGFSSSNNPRPQSNQRPPSSGARYSYPAPPSPPNPFAPNPNSQSNQRPPSSGARYSYPSPPSPSTPFAPQSRPATHQSHSSIPGVNYVQGTDRPPPSFHFGNQSSGYRPSTRPSQNNDPHYRQSTASSRNRESGRNRRPSSNRQPPPAGVRYTRPPSPMTDDYLHYIHEPWTYYPPRAPPSYHEPTLLEASEVPGSPPWLKFRLETHNMPLVKLDEIKKRLRDKANLINPSWREGTSVTEELQGKQWRLGILALPYINAVIKIEDVVKGVTGERVICRHVRSVRGRSEEEIE